MDAKTARVGFEERGKRSTQQKPSKSGWDNWNLGPQKAFVVEVGAMIDEYASLTPPKE